MEGHAQCKYVAPMRILLAALAALVLSTPLSAQRAEPHDVSTGPAPCERGRIGLIVVDNHSIFDLSDPDLDQRFDWAYELANRLHRRTREDVIRRELLLQVGDCYDPERLEDSERLLRALGFLAEVDIYAVQQDDGDYQVVVDTQDEWSTVPRAHLDFSGGFEVDGAAIEEANLLGTGREVELFYEDRSPAQTYGVEYHTPQMFETRWDLTARLGHTRAGTVFEQTVAYPFVGEYGRWAAVQSFRRRDRLFDLLAGAPPAGVDALPDPETHLLLPVREKAMEVGLVRRIGPVGGQSLIGGAIAYQELSYPGGRPRSVLVVGSEYDDTTEASGPYLDPIWSELNELQNIRAFLLLGYRSIDWIERSRLDALRATQDLRVGAELSLALGRSLPGIELADDLFGTVTFFGGAAYSDKLLVSTDLRLDARRDFDAPTGTPEWRDVIGEARVLAYWTPAWTDRHTFVARAAVAGGWNNGMPFQLTLGGARTLRGYDDWRFPGGRRALLSIEDRFFAGWPLPELLDVGLTAHVDVGRVWPGDLPRPYGLDSGWKASGGLGVRANFPAGGRTTYRIDYAVPFDGGIGDGRLLLSVGEVIGIGNRFDRHDIVRSRLSGVSGELFNFPR